MKTPNTMTPPRPPLDVIRDCLTSGGDYFEPLPDIPDEALSHVIDAIAQDLALPGLQVDVTTKYGQPGLELSIRQVLAHEGAEGQTPDPEVNLLAAVRQVAAQAQAAGKPVLLMAIPRELALRLTGELAEAQAKAVCLAHLETLRSHAAKVLMIIIDGIPVLAMPLPAPLICLWYGEPEGTLKAAEEHPAYPGVPFSRRIADTEPNRLSAFGRNLITTALKITERAVDMHASAADFMLKVKPGRRSLVAPADLAEAQDESALPESDDEAFAKIESQLGRFHGELVEAIANDETHQIKMRNVSEALLTRVKELFEDRLNASVTSTEPDEQGFVTIRIQKRLIL